MEMSRKNERESRIILIDKHLLRNEKKELLYIQKYKIESQKTSFFFPVRKSSAFMFRIPLKSVFRFLSVVIITLGYESWMFLKAENSRFNLSNLPFWNTSFQKALHELFHEHGFSAAAYSCQNFYDLLVFKCFYTLKICISYHLLKVYFE